MNLLLWSLTALLSLIPPVMFLVYLLRRLNTRRKMLLGSILTLRLEDDYMRIRHGHSYESWRRIKSVFKPDPKSNSGEAERRQADREARRRDFEKRYFNEDFRADSSFVDYICPVMLMTALGAAGWYFVLSRVHPAAGMPELNQLVPAAFSWGFVGAFFACVSRLIGELRNYGLVPAVYYSLAFRLLFSSTAAVLAGQIFSDNVSTLVAFGIGLFPIAKTWDFISTKTALVVGATQKEEELGAGLMVIQGLKHSENRQRLIDIGITSVQALATADPLLLFLRTTFPIRTVVDMIDKAILYQYIGDKVEVLRAHGINGVIELVALANLAGKKAVFQGSRSCAGGEGFSELFGKVDVEKLIGDVANVMGQSADELKAFMYNMNYDPVVIFIYDVWGRYLGENDQSEPDRRTDAPSQPTGEPEQPASKSSPPADEEGGPAPDHTPSEYAAPRAAR